MRINFSTYKLSIDSCLITTSLRMHFMAKYFSEFLSLTKYTFPKVPLPMIDISSNSSQLACEMVPLLNKSWPLSRALLKSASSRAMSASSYLLRALLSRDLASWFPRSMEVRWAEILSSITSFKLLISLSASESYSLCRALGDILKAGFAGGCLGVALSNLMSSS